MTSGCERRIGSDGEEEESTVRFERGLSPERAGREKVRNRGTDQVFLPTFRGNFFFFPPFLFHFKEVKKPRILHACLPCQP